MSNKQTLYAAGVLVVLVIIYFLTQTGNVDTKSIDAELLQFSQDEVTQVELKSAGTNLSFKREGESWSLDNYPVDTVRMTQLLEIFAELSVDRMITRNSEKYEKYEVSESGSRVTLKNDADKVLLDLLIGKQGANFQESFVRQMDQDEVYAVKSNLSQYKQKTQNDFWDRTMTDLDVNRINQVRFEGNLNYTLRREGPVWYYNEAQVDLEKVNNLLKPLENLKASNFTTEIGADKEHYQTIDLGFEGGEQLQLNCFLKDANGALLLVKVSNKDKMFEYSKSGLNRYQKELSDLIADPPPEG